MLRTLAIAAVIIVVLLAQTPAAIRTVVSGLNLVFGSGVGWLQRDAVTSTERAAELAAKGLRGQLVSFGSGMDSLHKDETDRSLDDRYDLYAIPVEQVSLDQPERIQKLTGTGLPMWRPENAAEPAPYSVSGKYSNILLFDRRTGEFQKLFDGRVSISKFQRGWNTKPEVLVIFAANRDSDGNGTMDDNDLHDIYILTLSDRALHKVANMSTNPSELIQIPNVDYIVVKAKIDHDRNGSVSQYSYDEDAKPEPDMLFRIDLKTFAAVPFVPEAMVQDLQKTLDAAPDKPALPTTK